ncbi:ras-related protein rab-18-B-like protein [Saitoella complicata NRRL Y-17804]|uniref:ras-related protein rab-18-B-like protein n=1 Tax=Saitoella complicata (strain BCRC 22490 / CBS 7301 / JCM 7358 / NBRC 10748 / NRRL Y-17804) TaxID=698492 RepID=UPI0008678B97|nr:ras-related protein rab-18-B-like protein [Saitoella complicata NRRL Y-17804]ODQ54426.1 ras-related protein rab-18-B-like protein [Saitoella complicata NRRL Y-17804]
MAPFEDDYVPTLKILLIGNSSVGKSALMLRFTNDMWAPEESSTTIGVDFKVKMVMVGGKPYKLTVWDTAGQERFRTLTKSYYRNAQAVLVDITNRATFEELPRWLKELEANTASDIVKVLVGNKLDKDSSRAVTTEEGEDMADRYNVGFLEASAKSNTHVKECFMEMVETIIETPTLWGQSTTGLLLPRGDDILELEAAREENGGLSLCQC